MNVAWPVLCTIKNNLNESLYYDIVLLIIDVDVMTNILYVISYNIKRKNISMDTLVFLLHV